MDVYSIISNYEVYKKGFWGIEANRARKYTYFDPFGVSNWTDLLLKSGCFKGDRAF